MNVKQNTFNEGGYRFKGGASTYLIPLFVGVQ